jgi:methylase of polypeptide subunit release factors
MGLEELLQIDGATPHLSSTEDYADLRACLIAARFDETGLQSVLGGKSVEHMQHLGGPSFEYLCRGDMPAAVLARLFLAGATVPARALADVIYPCRVDYWRDCGLLIDTAGGMRARYALTPFGGDYYLHDWPAFARERRDYVMGLGRSSLWLRAMLPRQRVNSALDLGCGCGPVSVAMARFAGRVLSSDTNPRAVALTRFNAALNGLSQVEARVGAWFEPAADEQFDLIASNPPFVVSPASRYSYRDGGLSLDGVTETVCRGAAAKLADGGVAVLIGNWVQRRGEDWRQRLAPWFGGADAWVLRSDAFDPVAYAARWIQHTESVVLAEQQAEFERWMAYYSEHGVEAIGSGLIVLRRRVTAQPIRAFEDAPSEVHGDGGADVLRGLALRAWLIEHDAEDLLRCRLRVLDCVRLQQVAHLENGRWSIDQARLSRSAGIGYAGAIDPFTATLVSRCDGRSSLAAVIAELAPIAGIGIAELTQRTIPVVQELLHQGFLELDAEP